MNTALVSQVPTAPVKLVKCVGHIYGIYVQLQARMMGFLLSQASSGVQGCIDAFFLICASAFIVLSVLVPLPGSLLLFLLLVLAGIICSVPRLSLCRALGDSCCGFGHARTCTYP